MDITVNTTYVIGSGLDEVTLSEGETRDLLYALAETLGVHVGGPATVQAPVPTASEVATARHQKILAIKDYRARTGMDLLTSKLAIEAHSAKFAEDTPTRTEFRIVYEDGTKGLWNPPRGVLTLPDSANMIEFREV
jgi:hypothetical protein